MTAFETMPMTEGAAIPFAQELIDAGSGAFASGERYETGATTMFGELARWTEALRMLRS